jgi:hypothetical protein
MSFLNITLFLSFLVANSSVDFMKAYEFYDSRVVECPVNFCFTSHLFNELLAIHQEFPIITLISTG